MNKIERTIEEVKNRIVVSLVKPSEYANIINDIPHKEYQDLLIVYKSIISSTEDEMMVLVVDNDMLNILGMTQEELHQIAMQNTKKQFPIKICTLRDILIDCIVRETKVSKDIAEGLFPKTPEDSSRYMITSDVPNHLNGATCMTYKDEIEGLANVLDSDLYLIANTSSEVMVLPKKDYEVSQVMEIRDILEGDYKDTMLSNNIYLYDHVTKTMSIPKDMEMILSGR